MNDELLARTVDRITIISIVSLIVGGLLMWKGFQGAEIALTIASSGLSGLVGFIGGKMASKAPETSSPVTPPAPSQPETKS